MVTEFEPVKTAEYIESDFARSKFKLLVLKETKIALSCRNNSKNHEIMIKRNPFIAVYASIPSKIDPYVYVGFSVGFLSG